MDDHSKREGLEFVFCIRKAFLFYVFFSLKPVTNSSDICYLKNNYYVACHVTYGKACYTSKC